MTESQDREFEETEGASLSVDPILETFVRLAEEQDLSNSTSSAKHARRMSVARSTSLSLASFRNHLATTLASTTKRSGRFTHLP